MGRLRRKRMHKNDKHLTKKYKTKRRTKDLDQIHEDMIPHKSAKLLSQDTDTDLPGCGQFYCLHCARYFVDNKGLQDHFKGRVHKKRLRMLKDIPYTLEESEKAGGQGSYTLTSKSKVPLSMDTDTNSEVSMEKTGSDATEA